VLLSGGAILADERTPGLYICSNDSDVLLSSFSKLLLDAINKLKELLSSLSPV